MPGMTEHKEKKKWGLVLTDGLQLGFLVATIGTLAEALFFEKLSLGEIASTRFVYKWIIYVLVFSGIMCLLRLWQLSGRK